MSEVLKNGEQKYLLMSFINNLPDNVYFKDRESRFILVNKAMAGRIGLEDPSLAVGKSDFDFFTFEHAADARKDEEEIMRSGKPLMGKQEYETLPNGIPKWVLTTKAPLYDDAGELVGTFGISRDITQMMENERELKRHRDNLEEIVHERTEELKKSNQKLHKEIEERRNAENLIKTNEERYRRFLSASPTYIYTVTYKNGVPASTEHGPGCVSVTGYEPEDYIKDPDLWIVMVHPEDRERVRKFVNEDLMKRKDNNVVEHRIVNKEGTLRWVRNTIIYHYDKNGIIQGYDGLVEDISERKKTEQALRETDKLKAVGALASGAAHNFSNIINIIGSNASSIMDRLSEGTVSYDNASRILDATKHAANLTKRLASMAKASDAGIDTKIEQVSLAAVIDDAIELMEHPLATRKVTIDVQEKDELPYVMANSSQLVEVMVNLLVNAGDAMPKGGKIKIGVSYREIRRPFHRWNTNAKPGNFVVLRISDQGIGMDKETVSRIFEPFFTTKKSVTAFGLGLTFVKEMVQSWGGWILLKSKPNEGTIFRIFIPLSTTRPMATRPESVISGKMVLLVDDDQAILDSMKKAMEQKKIKVLTATKACDALKIFKEHSDSISVSVVDFILADADWRKTVAGIYDMKPDADIIVTSGFSKDYVRHTLKVGTFSFLQKPFGTEHLIDTVTELISQKE